MATSSIVAFAVMFASGFHGLRLGHDLDSRPQRAVLNEFMGRVGGVYRVASVGGMVIGVPIGGVLAASFGITAPFWFGFVGSAVLVTLLWRQLAHIAHD